MASKLLLCLLVGVAVLAFATQAASADVSNGTTSQPDDNQVYDSDDDGDAVFGDDKIDDATEFDGIALCNLTVDEIRDLLEDDDNRVKYDIDIWVAKKEISERKQQTRRKRWIGIAARLFQAGRSLFKGSTAGRVSTSGSRVTRQYQRSGNYNDALRDFNKFRPDNVKSFGGKISGKTGTVGNHRITVRNGSSNGRPTLEIRSPKGKGEFVRKFRYN
ncbi:uncharacterized protein LOC131940044 [Physella acuta]|uniref:uncharacterized protein LOC131940044 n=1 Tax=Physella acuta TaxID=109671 RepID=UPI0027DB028E|nr:uncharacterized protein LOC131940044 [Physella acuta]